MKSARPYMRPKSSVAVLMCGGKGKTEVSMLRYRKAKHVVRQLTKGLVIDKQPPRAGTHHKADVGNEVLQEIPSFPVGQVVGGPGHHARHVRAGHGVQRVQGDGVDEAGVDGQHETGP